MNRKFIIRLVIVLVVLFLMFGCIFGFNIVKFYMTKAFLKKFTFPPAVVNVVKVKAQDWQPTFGAVGTIEGTQDVEIASQVSGTLLHYYVDSGEYVSKGQKIVSLDYSVEEAELQKALAMEKLSQLKYNQAMSLYQKGANSKVDLQTAESTLKQDEAAVSQLRAQIAQHIIRAPFSGKMGIMPTNLGQYITAGNSLGTMTQTKTLYVTFPITQQQLPYVKVGAAFNFMVDTYPHKVYMAKVSVIDSGLSSNTQAIDVRGEIANTDKKHPLYSGMLADVNVLLPKLKNVIVVPQTAIVESLYGASVYTVKTRKNKNDKTEQYAHQVFVTVGPAKGDNTVITKGLKSGATIVTEGQVKLQNGTTVKVEANNAS